MTDYLYTIEQNQLLQAQVVRVIDGDTIEVELLTNYDARLADGSTVRVLEANRNYRVRFIGVNCPEKTEQYYDEATQFTKQILQPGRVVYLELGPHSYNETNQRWDGLFDVYNRLLAYVWLNAPPFDSQTRRYLVDFNDAQQHLLNAKILASGWAVLKLVPPHDVRYVPWFRQLTSQQQQKRLGLFQPKVQIIDIQQSGYLLSEYFKRYAGKYAFNGTDAKVYQSNVDVHDLNTANGRSVVNEIKQNSVLLDHIQHLQIFPSQTQQQVYSQFHQQPVQYLKLPTYWEGRIGFNVVVPNTFEILTKAQIQTVAKTENKMIFNISTILVEFSNPWTVQHESYIVLKHVNIFQREFVQSTSQLPAQEVYEITAEDVEYIDIPITAKDYAEILFEEVKKNGRTAE